MANYFAALDDSDDEGPRQPQAAPVKATSTRAPVGAKASGSRKPRGGSTAMATQNEGAAGRPRRSDRQRDGNRRGGRDERRSGGAGGRAPRREFDRRSGTGRGNESRRGGGGPRSWGNGADDAAAATKARHADAALAVAEAAEGGDALNALDAEGSTPVPQEPEPEDSYVSLDSFLKKTQEEKKTSDLVGELSVREADAGTFKGRAHVKATAAAEDDVQALLGSGLVAKKAKKAKKVAAMVDSKLLRFKSGGDDYRPPREDRPRREGGDRPRGPRREGGDRPRRDGGRREGGDRPRGGRGAPKRQAAPATANLPKLGSK